jgi:hypothetical protein
MQSSVLLTGLVVLFSTTQAMGQALCKPDLMFKQARLSEAKDQKRVWTGVINVDASRCDTSSGSFEIRFIRLKETGPDLLFSEWFKWSLGQVEVALDFWWDESVGSYWLGDVKPCACRS